MATSGSFQTHIAGTAASGRHYKVDWEITSQSVANNTSTVKCTHYLICDSAWTTYLVDGRKIECTVGGVTKSFTSAEVSVGSSGGTVKLGTSTHVVPHNNNGTKTASFSSTFNPSGSSGYTGTATSSATFPTIARASSIGASDANIGASTTIVISRASKNFTHTITYSFKGLTGTIKSKTSDTTISWTIPTSFYAKIPDAKTGTVTLTCTTYSGSSSIGTYTATFTVTAANSSPIVTGTVIDTNAEAIVQTGSNTRFIQYISNALCTIDASAQNSATIVSKKIAGVAVSGNTRTINGVSGTVVEGRVIKDIVFEATDSRGYTTRCTKQIELVGYVSLTASGRAYRPIPTSGEVVLELSGQCYNGCFDVSGQHVNVLAATWKYRLAGSSSWTSGGNLTLIRNGNTYSVNTSLGSFFEYTNAYEIEIDVVDTLASTQLPLAVGKGIPVFDWGENDFNFNVPIHAPSVTLGSKLPLNEGGTGADNVADARANLGCMQSLCVASGNGYAVGTTITIPDVDNYTLFLIRVKSTGGTTQVISVIATKTADGNTIAGIGGQALNNTNGDMRSAQVRLTKSTGGWNLTHCGYITHTAGGSHSASTTLNISEIIGIL